MGSKVNSLVDKMARVTYFINKMEIKNIIPIS